MKRIKHSPEYISEKRTLKNHRLISILNFLLNYQPLRCSSRSGTIMSCSAVTTCSTVMCCDNVMVRCMTSISCFLSRKLRSQWRFSIIPNMQTYANGRNFSVTNQQHGAKDGFCQDIQYTIKDSLGIRRNDISTFSNPPCDGIQKPEEDCLSRSQKVDTTDIGTKNRGVLKANPKDIPNSAQQCGTPKHIVSPLIAGFHQCPN